jgi:FKBP-type peptidyl-prolyl cis-trans isomerase 2
MAIQKNDFVELEFTGKSDGKIFDTTKKQEAKEIGLDADVKPVIVAVGHEMLLTGFDKALEGKELGKTYSIHLTPKEAFGSRKPELIRTAPMKIFLAQNIRPAPGMTVQLDNHLAKILSVSGGRVTVDFNNPLAGKEIDYDFLIKKKVEDDNEKINALQDFFFKQRFDFDIKDKKVIFKDNKIKPLIEMFRQKFKDIAGLDVEVAEKPAEKK